ARRGDPARPGGPSPRLAQETGGTAPQARPAVAQRLGEVHLPPRAARQAETESLDGSDETRPGKPWRFSSPREVAYCCQTLGFMAFRGGPFYAPDTGSASRNEVC